MNRLEGNEAERIQATREGGTVERLHAAPHNHQYNVAEHSFGALNLLLILHAGPSLNLVKAVQWHDIPERWTGDVPATAKWMCKELREALALLENPIMERFGLNVELTESERYWLNAVDILDLWLYCRDNQEELRVKPVYDACCKYINTLQLEGKFPWEAWEFFKLLVVQEPHPLPDILDGLDKATP